MKGQRNFLFLWLLSLSCHSYAVNGELGRWLEHEAGPALAELIESEPRFIGEAIGFATLKGGHLAPLDSRLAQDLGNGIRRSLLQRSGIRVPLEPENCQVAKEDIVLAIDIRRLDHARHRVEFALVDREESLWINRSLQTWTGRLSRVQYQHLGQLSSIATGTADSTSHSNGDMGQSSRCRPPDLDDNDVPGKHPPLFSQQLISAISRSDRRTTCQGHGRYCVDVEYTTLQDTYLFEFITLRGRIIALSTGQAPELRYGKFTKGLKVPVSQVSNRPSVGYYILATQYRDTAAELVRFFSENAQGKAGPDDKQLRRLSELVSQRSVQWQALHLTTDGRKVRTL